MTILGKAKPPQGVQAEGASQTTSSKCILLQLEESIKADFQAAKHISIIDYPPEQRPYVMGIIAALRDELPIRSGWHTVRESHLSETRLRARRYHIPGEFLREPGHE